MSEDIKWGMLIEQNLLGGIQGFCAEKKDLVKGAFLTGSFVRGKHNPRNPNVNVYFVSHANCSGKLRIELASLWAKTRDDLTKRKLGFEVDCHPYTVSWKDPQKAGWPTLTLTTKVFDDHFKDSRFSLAPTIGLGWLASHRMLWGEENILDALKMQPTSEEEWLQSIHEAQTRYRNILDHLPNALPWDSCPRMLSEESVKYAIESMRDAVLISLPFEDMSQGRHITVLHGRTEEDYYTSLGWKDVAAAATKVSLMAKDLEANKLETKEDAVKCWEDAVGVCSVVWSRFSERVRSEMKVQNSHRWLLRTNTFV